MASNILDITQMVYKIWNNNKDKPIELKILSNMPNSSNEFMRLKFFINIEK